jgi:hypothetical protein
MPWADEFPPPWGSKITNYPVISCFLPERNAIALDPSGNRSDKSAINRGDRSLQILGFNTYDDVLFG